MNTYFWLCVLLIIVYVILAGTAGKRWAYYYVMSTIGYIQLARYIKSKEMEHLQLAIALFVIAGVFGLIQRFILKDKKVDS